MGESAVKSGPAVYENIQIDKVCFAMLLVPLFQGPACVYEV